MHGNNIKPFNKPKHYNRYVIKQKAMVAVVKSERKGSPRQCPQRRFLSQIVESKRKNSY